MRVDGQFCGGVFLDVRYTVKRYHIYIQGLASNKDQDLVYTHDSSVDSIIRQPLRYVVGLNLITVDF